LEVAALKEVSFKVQEGEFVSIVGPSGCGKSTIIKMVAALVKPTTGSVLFRNKEVENPQRSIGVVFQDPALLEWRKVLSNVMLPVEVVSGIDEEEYRKNAHQLIAKVGLSGFEDKYPYELSGGMRQRVALCRAMINDPRLLLMDEPFGALDAMTRDQMNIELSRLLERTAKTIMFVTHSIIEAVFLSDRIIVMTPRPGQVSSIIDVKLPRPRTPAVKLTEDFAKIVAEVTRALGLETGDGRE